VVVALAVALCALTVEARRVNMKFDTSLDARQEIRSQAQLVSRINAEGAKMMAEQTRLGVQGYFCKTIYASDAREFTWASEFVNGKYGDWLPPAQKSLSVFLQGEASAAAFVGISAGIGIGMDLTVELTTTPKTVTGQVVLFACVGADLSVGYVGASASAGVGVMIGFGKFKDSVLESNTEIEFDIEALVGGGVGILVQVDEKVVTATAFRDAWNAYKVTQIGAAAPTPDYKTKIVTFFKRVAHAGIAQLHAIVKGVHIFGGVGVGGGGGVSVSVDLQDIIRGIKAGWDRVWASKAGGWVKNTKAWQALKKTMTKLGNTKFGQHFKGAVEASSKFLRKVVDGANEFFDYTAVADAEAETTP